MTHINFGAITCLSTLKFAGLLLDYPDQRRFPESEIKMPLTRLFVINADEFIDHSLAELEAKHESDELSCISFFQENKPAPWIFSQQGKKLLIQPFKFC